MSFYEIRQYEVKPGKMESWISFFNREILPFQVARGMVVCGLFHGETDDSLFMWIRRFESEEHREKTYKAVYEDPEWLEKFKDRIGEHINREKIICNRVLPLEMSILK